MLDFVKNYKDRSAIFTLTLVFLLFTTTAPATAQNTISPSLSSPTLSQENKENKENKYKPYLEIGGAKYFNQNSNVAGIYDLFVPILQNENHLFFTDLRIFDRSGSSFEGNAHLGFRKIDLDKKQMIGIYGAFDHRISDKRNSFNQIMMGFEFWHKNIFIGANLYKPIGKTQKYVGTTIDRQVVTSRGISWLETTSKEFYEKALPGVDAELGYSFTDNLNLFVGGYYYHSSGAKTMAGPKIQVTYDYREPRGRILGIVDGISIEAGVQHDKPRGTSAYIGIKFKIGLTKLDNNTNLFGFERHMVEPVRRDPDITVAQLLMEQHLQEQLSQIDNTNKILKALEEDKLSEQCS